MIQARELTKRYGDATAMHPLSFTNAPGTVTGFLGPNGAGIEYVHLHELGNPKANRPGYRNGDTTALDLYRSVLLSSGGRSALRYVTELLDGGAVALSSAFGNHDDLGLFGVGPAAAPNVRGDIGSTTSPGSSTPSTGRRSSPKR